MRSQRSARKLFVHELENRTTPAVAVSVNGGLVSFLGDGANDSLNLSISPTGTLLHNLTGGGLASATDLDPTTAGSQEVMVVDLTTLTINLGGGYDSVSFTNVSSTGSVSAESLLLETRDGGDITLSDTSFAYNGKPMAISGVSSVGFGCDDGDNTIDASAWTLSNLTILAYAGNDTLKGGSGNDGLYGNDQLDDGNYWVGHDTLDDGNYWAGNDTLNGGPGNDRFEGGEGHDTHVGGDGDDLLTDGPGMNSLDGGSGTDTVLILGTPAADVLAVSNGSVSINGNVSTYSNIETLTADTGAGIDVGNQVPMTHPLPYTVARLEPMVSAGLDVTNTDTPFVVARTGSFQDIGSGQTWTATIDYAEGDGFVPLALNLDKTFTLNHAYTTGGVFNVRVRVIDDQGNVGEDTFVVVRSAGIQVGLVGGAQRSVIDQLTVSLAGVQNLQSGWYTFERLTPGPLPSVTVSVSQVGNQTVAFFTFSGADVLASSIADGRYRLTLNSDKIRDPFSDI